MCRSDRRGQIDTLPIGPPRASRDDVLRHPVSHTATQLKLCAMVRSTAGIWISCLGRAPFGTMGVRPEDRRRFRPRRHRQLMERQETETVAVE